MRASTVSKDLHKPLKRAFDASGMSLAQLVRAAGLGITPMSMKRKLEGTQSIGIDNGEADAIGSVFGFKSKWTGTRFAYVKKVA